MRDRLIFGIRDVKVRERLLRESGLTLQKTDEICRASESTAAQMKEVGQGDTVSAVNFSKKSRRPRDNQTNDTKKPCGKCGRFHEPGNCAARGKTCGDYGKPNHFASVCRSGKRRGNVNSVKTLDEELESNEDPEELHIISDVAAVTLDDSQLVTLQLDSGNCLSFQPDTGAQCNVIPVHLYKRAANDPELSRVKPIKSEFLAYGGAQLPVVGQVILRVWLTTSSVYSIAS